MKGEISEVASLSDELMAYNAFSVSLPRHDTVNLDRYQELQHKYSISSWTQYIVCSLTVPLVVAPANHNQYVTHTYSLLRG